MDRKNNYQRIELLTDIPDEPNDCSAIENDKLNKTSEYEREVELFTSSSESSSSPPNQFDINAESQYVPIFDENDSPNQDVNNQQSSSIASSLSIGSNHDYTNTSPTIITNRSRVIRCPVCQKPMRTFYCAKCIQKGHFVTLDTSVHTSDKQFSETKLTNSDTESSTLDGAREIDVVDEQRSNEEMLQIKFRTLAKRTEALKSLYIDQKLKLDETLKLVKETRAQLDIEKKSNRSKESKIDLIQRYITSRKSSVKKRKDAEARLLEDLKQHVQRKVFQLLGDVFPIEEVNLLEQNNSIVDLEASPLLTFSDGSYHQNEQQTAFSIVVPWLPSNGDYSSYSLWINDNRDHIPASVSDLSERNPAFRIGAGLAYVTQLVMSIASYMDIELPCRIDHDTFSRELLNDVQFSYHVAKLNTNVIHLCVLQGVDVSLLNPQRTLRNLMLLFNLNISDLGRKPVMELTDNEDVAMKIEEQLTGDLSNVQEVFYDFSKFADDDDVSDSEWEISGTINPMEMQLATEQSIQQNSYISRLPMRLFASFWSTGS